MSPPFQILPLAFEDVPIVVNVPAKLKTPRCWRALVALLLAALACARPPVPASAQSPPGAGPGREGFRQTAPEAVFEALGPEEKVGQIFLVAFYAPPGQDDPLQDVLDLIRAQKIGGVVLQKSSLAFSNRAGEALPEQIAALTTRLQEASLGPEGSGLPLFVAVDHEGDGDPRSHLREGFTAPPSQMALGATWDPDAVETVGRIVGQELSAVGVNLLLGPVMDVLADPRVDTGGDIGIRAFGGHPYWVARMGLSYIRGVHEGSQGRVSTVAKHFPGHGGSDRNPDQRAGTVYKSLNELKRVELPPFAAITDPDAPTVTDGLMTSHIRYSGFQGPNIMDVTPPVSFDQSSLRQIMQLDEFRFDDWQRAGGLIFSDALGVNAVKYYFDPSGESFNPREVARQAFLAGNDVLIISQFGIGAEGGVAWSEQRANIRTTIDYFADQYRRDERFRQRVDAAVMRILRRKAAMYPRWDLESVAPHADDLIQVGSADSRAAMADVARRGVSVLRAIRRPEPGDRLVVVSQDPLSAADEARRPLACPYETCGLDPARWERLRTLGPTLVESFMLEDFGPGGSGTVDPGALRSLTFCQLETALSPPVPAPTPDPAAPEDPPAVDDEAAGSGPTQSRSGCLAEADRAGVLEDLARADWIIFAVADLGTREQISVLNGFFLRQLDRIALTQARLAVLGFGAPYYLDATNYTRLDFYAAAYSKVPAAIEAGVDALLDPLWVAEGKANLPVTYEDSGYVLDERLSPDPARPLPIARIGDRALSSPPTELDLEIGPVIDRNGNSVPDGTVILIESVPAEALEGGQVSVLTRGGLARAELRLLRGGDLALSARAGDASGPTLRLSLPTPQPSPTPPGPSESLSAPAEGARANAETRLRPRPADFFLALAAIVLASLIAAGLPGWSRLAAELQLRSLLATCCGGLTGYLLWGGALLQHPAWPGWMTGSVGAAGSALIGSALAGGLTLLLGRRGTSRGSRPARPGTA